MVRFVTIKKFSDQSGYTEDAIRSKIRDGIWREGSEWVRAPDGRNLIDTEGYEKWVELNEGESNQPRQVASRSRSSTRGKGAGRRSSSTPPPLI